MANLQMGVVLNTIANQLTTDKLPDGEYRVEGVDFLIKDGHVYMWTVTTVCSESIWQTLATDEAGAQKIYDYNINHSTKAEQHQQVMTIGRCQVWYDYEFDEMEIEVEQY